MTSHTFVRTRVDLAVKDGATEVLAAMGLTVSDAVRMLLAKVARDRELPFDPTPNALTLETLTMSAKGEDVHRAPDAEALFKDLGI